MIKKNPEFLFTIIVIALSFYIPMYFIFRNIPEVRIIIYLFPLLFFIEALTRKSNNTNQTLLIIIVALLILFLPKLDTTKFSYQKEFVFILLSLGLFVRFRQRSTDALLYIMASSIIFVIVTILLNNNQISFVYSVFGSSKISTEASLGLATPIIFLVFLQQKKYTLAIVALIVSLFLFKRLAIFGAFFIGVISILVHPSSNARFAIIFITGCILFMFGLNINEFYELVSGIYNKITGDYVDANNISSGRYNAAKIFYSYFSATKINLSTLIGYGAGFTTEFLLKSPYLSGKNFILMHNDYMRSYFDYGILGSSLMLYFFALIFSKSNIGFWIGLYTLFIFLTDNSLTYVFYWLIVFLALQEK